MASFTLLARPIFSSFRAFQKVWVRCSSSNTEYIRPPGLMKYWTKDEYNAYQRWRYATKPDYRRKCIEYAKKYIKRRYECDPDFRQKVLDANNQWYAVPEHKQKLKDRYANDPEFRKAKIQRYSERYASDLDFRQAKLQRERERYANDLEYQEVIKQRALERYANDSEYRELTKQRARERYWRNKYGLSNHESRQQSLDEPDTQDKSNKSDTGL
ncbi:unnamed protein product [Aureobasidium mustum]|uniref:Uncharacterized protein n=1 Tax=Aureobasidium mustum TaxID=2773714 RepID=A0A9N8K607_9PEZI|nr:unnamed protein product [Aureobasidium mustum]